MRVSDKTIVIPGHGPIGNKSQLIEFRDMLVSIREKVTALKKEGKSLAEVLAAKPTANYDAKWGGFVIDGKNFTGLVYQGVWLNGRLAADFAHRNPSKVVLCLPILHSPVGARMKIF